MQAIISIGSNIRPAENVRKSIELLSKYTRIRNVSNVYRSPAENRPDQPWFYNCVVIIETDLSAERLQSDVLRKIEANLGRVRTDDKFAARTIDLDLLVCRSVTGSASESATIALDILKRPYIAIPLAELDPGLLLGEDGMSLGKAVGEAPRDSIEKLSGYSATIFGKFDIENCDNSFKDQGEKP